MSEHSFIKTFATFGAVAISFSATVLLSAIWSKYNSAKEALKEAIKDPATIVIACIIAITCGLCTYRYIGNDDSNDFCVKKESRSHSIDSCLQEHQLSLIR